MQIEVTTRHGSISDETRDHLATKTEKLLTYFERVTSIRIMVDLEKPLAKSVEILVDTEHKHDFVATSAGEDVLGAFDRALHKMEQQIKKYKERIQDHRRDLPMNELVSSEEVDGSPTTDPADGEPGDHDT